MAGVHEGPEYGVGDFVLLSTIDIKSFMENLQKRSVGQLCDYSWCRRK